MTDEEFGEWGRAENRLRQQEMEGVASEADLKRVQAACAARRKAAGLSAGEASHAVVVGQRLDRGVPLYSAISRSR